MTQWHWISSAVSLAAMLLFTVTGITLNHAEDIATKPKVTSDTAQLPEELLSRLSAEQAEGSAPLPAEVERWLSAQFRHPIGLRQAEWSEDEVYLSMPAPGVDAWLAIDRTTGEAEYERTDRGWIAYFNDLHKGRHTGTAWKAFIDLFAASTLMFCLTGLVLLQLRARQRRFTWHAVALGLLIPLIVAVLLVH